MRCVWKCSERSLRKTPMLAPTLRRENLNAMNVRTLPSELFIWSPIWSDTGKSTLRSVRFVKRASSVKISCSRIIFKSTTPNHSNVRSVRKYSARRIHSTSTTRRIYHLKSESIINVSFVADLSTTWRVSGNSFPFYIWVHSYY